MRPALHRLLRCPKTGGPLELVPFTRRAGSFDEEDVAEGILFGEHAVSVYPIEGGVPILLEGALTADFLARHAAAIAADPVLAQMRLAPGGARSWSFSEEWKHHFEKGVSRTWEWTVEERVSQFLLETQTDPDTVRGCLILDAGCGNGQLTEALTRLGATVVGLDMSSSILGAESARRSSDVHFVGGDLLAPPFPADSFDIAVSNGVLHHSPSTERAFHRVARLVKPGGLFYVWLYREPQALFERRVSMPLRESVRAVVSRLPSGVQRRFIESYSRARGFASRIVGKPQHISLAERTVLAYDALTPRWRFVHDPLEVAAWYFAAGFSAPVLTHWDNPHGFGMVARKVPLADTPGVRFGRRGSTASRQASVVGAVPAVDA